MFWLCVIIIQKVCHVRALFNCNNNLDIHCIFLSVFYGRNLRVFFTKWQNPSFKGGCCNVIYFIVSRSKKLRVFLLLDRLHVILIFVLIQNLIHPPGLLISNRHFNYNQSQRSNTWKLWRQIEDIILGKSTYRLAYIMYVQFVHDIWNLEKVLLMKIQNTKL